MGSEFTYRGHTYTLTAHAAQRLRDMGGPGAETLALEIVKRGDARPNPPRSKYEHTGSYYMDLGKVALAVVPVAADRSSIVTAVWRTDRDWEEWFRRHPERANGRTCRPGYLTSHGI